MAVELVEIALEGYDGRGLPEFRALSKRADYEKTLGKKLKFKFIRIGGFSFYAKGHPKFKIEPPTCSVWEVVPVEGPFLNLKRSRRASDDQWTGGQVTRPCVLADGPRRF